MLSCVNDLLTVRVLILSHDDVHKALTPDECAEAMASVLAAHARGEAFMPLRSIMAPPGAAGFMGLMPGWRGANPHDRDADGDALPEPPPPDKAVFSLKLRLRPSRTKSAPRQSCSGAWTCAVP